MAIDDSMVCDSVMLLLNRTGMKIDDYAKDGGRGEVRLLRSFCYESFALGLKQLLISLLFQIISL